jgi:superfamily II DNA or RNA helicase
MMRATLPPPRPFQVDTHIAAREAMLAGVRRLLIYAPTGSGKTIFALYLIAEALKKARRAIFVADRITLIDQTSNTAYQYGLVPHGIIQADHPMADESLPFQIASAQTLGRRRWPKADLIVIDEAHTQLRAWTEHIATCGAHVIGLSASPFSQGLGQHFEKCINAVTMAELVEQGTLVPMRVFMARRIDMAGAATAGGEWTMQAAGARGAKIVGDVVAEWQKHGENRKTICFGSTIAHCHELCRQFNEAGVLASVYCQDTPDHERRDLVNMFREQDSVLRVLISVEALAKGFDVPDVGCIIDCRPLRKSFSTWVQMVGRGARSSPATGKLDFILLDHTGNASRFANDFLRLYHEGVTSLDAGQQLDAAVRKERKEREPCACPKCGFYPFGKRCMSCGHSVQVQSGIVHAPGVLEEVIFGGKKLANDARNLFGQLIAYAGARQADPHKVLWRAKYLYRDIMKTLPPADWTLANCPQQPVTAATAGKIKSLQIRQAKGRAKEAADAV